MLIDNLIETSQIKFKTAKKTKPVKAKYVKDVIKDSFLYAQLKLNTLEGEQVVRDNCMICIGINNEYWQQDPNKIFKKYDVTAVDENGWLTFVPKPENEVWATCHCQFNDCAKDGGKFQIVGQYGTKAEDGRLIQTGNFGDYILQSKTDPTDTWIVAKNIFEASYVFLD